MSSDEAPSVIEYITQARAEILRKGLGWRYHVKWAGSSDMDASWMTDMEIQAISDDVVKEFWENIGSGLQDKDFSEGDVVCASKDWIRDRRRIYARPSHKKPVALNKPQTRVSDDEDRAFFRKRSFGTKADNAEASSSMTHSKQRNSSLDNHHSLLKQQPQRTKENPISISDSDSDRGTRSSKSYGNDFSRKEAKQRKLPFSISHDDEPGPSRPVYNQTTMNDVLRQRAEDPRIGKPDRGPGTRTRRSGVDPQSAPLRRKPESIKSVDVTLTVPSSSRKRKRSPSPTVSSKTKAKDTVLDLCTPSPEPELGRDSLFQSSPVNVPASPATTVSSQNRFSSFAYTFTARKSTTRTDKDKGKDKERDKYKAAEVVPKRKASIASTSELSKTQSKPQSPSQHDIIDLTDGVLELGQSTSTGPLSPSERTNVVHNALRQDSRSVASSRGEGTPLRHNGLLSRVDEHDTPSQKERTPLRPNGLLSSVSLKPKPKERTPLQPNGLLQPQTHRSPPRESRPLPLSLPLPLPLPATPEIRTPTHESRRSTSTLDNDNSDNTNENDINHEFDSLFRRRQSQFLERPEKSAASFAPAPDIDTGQISSPTKPAAATPTSNEIVEYEFTAPHSYREAVYPSLGPDERLISYRPSFLLELSEAWRIPVRTRDVVLAKDVHLVVPRAVFLAQAPIYAHLLQLMPSDIYALARVEPNPLRASEQDCTVFRILADKLVQLRGAACVELATDGPTARGLLFFPGRGGHGGVGRDDLGPAFDVPPQMRDAPVLMALVRLPPAPRRPPASGFFHF